MSTSQEKGVYGLWTFWLNEKGIVNLLSIPQLEKDGYNIGYNTKQDWVVTTPSGKYLLFETDSKARTQGIRGIYPSKVFKSDLGAYLIPQTFRCGDSDSV